MEIAPPLKIDRFAQLAPGDLFIWTHPEGSTVALKALDARQGDPLILPLGPQFPKGVDRARLLDERGLTAVSFGKDYVIRLPTAPQGWVGVEPDPGALCLLVTSDAIYFRANCGLRPDEYVRCLVDANDGKVRYGWMPSVAAHAVEWEITLKDAPHGLRTILQVQPTPAESTRS